MRTTVRQFVAAERRSFVLGIVPAAFHAGLPELIRCLCDARPDLDVSLVELTSIEQISALKEGRIDAGLGGLAVEDPDLATVVVKQESLLLAVPAGHALATADGPVDLRQLRAERVILYPSAPRPSFADHVLDLFERAQIVVDELIEVKEFYTALIWVAAGRGVCLMPESASMLAYPDVAFRSLLQPSRFQVRLCYRADDASAELRQFRSACQPG